MAGIRLSVLDQSPVPSGSTPAQALENTISLAQRVDELGYHRLWYSEHHAMELLAGSAPEILVARVGAETSRIRIGSGGIMLPHYSAYKVAEVFQMLEAFYPGRIDLGIGRAPGSGQLEAHALRRQRTGPVPDDFPQQLAELLAYLHPELFPANHPFSKVLTSPVSAFAPDVWLLGSSMWSSATAAVEGLPYAFAHFFSSQQTRQAIEHYRESFVPSQWRKRPEATLAIGVIVAQTQAEAERLALPVKLLQRRIRKNDRRPVATPEEAASELNAEPTAPNPLLSFTQGSYEQPEGEFPRYVVGTPDKVRLELEWIAQELKLEELIINTITHSHEARVRSYELLAEAMEIGHAAEQSAVCVS